MRFGKFRTRWLLPVTLVLSAAMPGFSYWNLSADADARVRWRHPSDFAAEIHAVGLSVRKTFADRSGDRYIFAGLLEAVHNFSELMVHELYFRYKGPMGLWNVTLGRFGIPYGLLTSFSTSRLLFESIPEDVVGLDADNGIMVSGIVGMLDYGVSITQGYGVHRLPEFPGEGLGVARLGLTFGGAEEFALGVSLAYGNVATEHGGHTAARRLAGGLDATANMGRTVLRGQIDAVRRDVHWLVTGYALLDFAVHRRVDLSAGARALHDSSTAGAVYAGFTFKPPWFTLRGGYSYAHSDKPGHEVSLQVYRLFAFTF
jgi:hypothetical protein